MRLRIQSITLKLKAKNPTSPRESIVRITRAESGGIGGTGKWRPAALGFRPRYENDAMKKYMQGSFIQDDKRSGGKS